MPRRPPIIAQLDYRFVLENDPPRATERGQLQSNGNPA